MTILPALAWLLGCAREEPAPPPEPDAARFDGRTEPGFVDDDGDGYGATDELVLTEGGADVCRWLFGIAADPDATPPCADPDGNACAIGVVGWRESGRPRSTGCELLGYTDAAAGEGGLVGVGWSDAWRVAGIDQGPGLAWWDGEEWILVESDGSTWDPVTGTLAWSVPAALPE